MNCIIKNSILLLIFLSSFRLIAQEQLTNKDIINLQTAKVSQDIILAKISSTKCQFDLTTQGLINLKAGKISDRVISAMFTASPPKETMTNQDVITLYNSDVSNSILKEKIKKTSHNFEVDSESLIKLKEAKINSGIVKEMILSPVLNLNSVQNTTSTVVVQNAQNTVNVVSNIPENAWEQIIVTNAYEEVKNLKRIGEISASASRAYGREERLRKEAIEKLKKEAATKGATHVLLQSNTFAPTPFNTVSLSGVAYKK